MIKFFLIGLGFVYGSIAIAQNVGIGTSNPASKLHVHENGTSSVFIDVSNNITSMGLGLVSFGTLASSFVSLSIATGVPFRIDQGGFPSLNINDNNNVGIGVFTPHASAILDISANNKGILIPRMTTAQMNAIPNPATGLLVYRTELQGAFQYYTGTNWMTLNSQLELITQNNVSGWRLRGANPANYGNIGVAAVDLSQSNGPGNTFGATGGYSFASGRNTTASGNNAVALGFNTLASGPGSAALGSSTKATSSSAMAFGAGTEATGSESTAFGLDTKASSQASVAFGFQTTASQFAATAFGSSTIASGNTSTAFGSNTTASGSSATAFGNGTTASDNTSTAFGLNTKASGTLSTAFGNTTTASGQITTAFGANSIASADLSTVFGQFTTASSFNSMVIGRFNVIPASVSVNNWIGTEPLFVIGNGTSNVSRNNAVTVIKNGNTGFGINNPVSAVHANSRIVIERPTGGSATAASLEWRSDGAYRGALGWDVNAARFFFYDGKSNTNTLFINNGRIGIQRDPTTNALEVNGNASKSSAGDWIANSDARLKKNMFPIQSALDKILQLKGITYEWSDDKTGFDRPAGFQYGFTAQNVQQVFPELVSTDAQGYLQTAYGTYDPVMVEAIRELVNKIEVLEKKIKELEPK